MSRFGLLVLLLLSHSASCQPTAAPGVAGSFDAVLAGRTYAAGLSFVALHALEPASIPDLAFWGMHGLATLDPGLTPERTNTALRLIALGRALYSRPSPPSPDAASWAAIVVGMTEAAWQASASVRRAGTAGVIESFFDEMFSHFGPYSRYVSPAEATIEEARRQGVSGVGLVLARRGTAMIALLVEPDSPAAEAGIRAGDRILEVDGLTTRGEDVATVSGWLAGPTGVAVTVAWQPRRARARVEEITRAVVPPKTVFITRERPFLVLRIAGFNDGTAQGLEETIAAAGRGRSRGIVLDLRDNRGGVLRQAVAAADELLPAGVVAITQGRDPAASRLLQSTPGEIAAGAPLVVLVDGRTASAAEILAAALADRGRAVVVGSATLGKGLVQTIARLPNGGELFVTWSRVLAPLGWPIQGLGLLPQVCTSRGEAALRTQLRWLATGTQPMAEAIARERKARAPVREAEALAIRAACPAAEGGDLDMQAARTLLEDPAAYAAALLPPMGEPPAAR